MSDDGAAPVSDAMSAEFDTVAEWTAKAAVDLGSSYRIPAACRGSGSPAALDWLISELGLAEGQTLLDCGAGVGGPAGYAVQQRAVRPILMEPEAGACRAAHRLFGYPVVQAVGSAVPFGDQSFDAAWSLGVLCTTSLQLELLRELRRVVRGPGRIGLLVMVAAKPVLDEQPDGNHFPTKQTLVDLIEKAKLRIEAWDGAAGMEPPPKGWQSRDETVNETLLARHGHERAWQVAERQSKLIGRLIADSQLSTELMVLSRG
jgi:SAM-dependent methyltransferase